MAQQVSSLLPKAAVKPHPVILPHVELILLEVLREVFCLSSGRLIKAIFCWSQRSSPHPAQWLYMLLKDRHTTKCLIVRPTLQGEWALRRLFGILKRYLRDCSFTYQGGSVKLWLLFLLFSRRLPHCFEISVGLTSCLALKFCGVFMVHLVSQVKKLPRNVPRRICCPEGCRRRSDSQGKFMLHIISFERRGRCAATLRYKVTSENRYTIRFSHSVSMKEIDGCMRSFSGGAGRGRLLVATELALLASLLRLNCGEPASWLTYIRKVKFRVSSETVLNQSAEEQYVELAAAPLARASLRETSICLRAFSRQHDDLPCLSLAFVGSAKGIILYAVSRNAG
eukprot:284818066_1